MSIKRNTQVSKISSNQHSILCTATQLLLAKSQKLEADGASPGVRVLERRRQPAEPLVQALAGERAGPHHARRPVPEVVQAQPLPHFRRFHRPLLRAEQKEERGKRNSESDSEMRAG